MKIKQLEIYEHKGIMYLSFDCVNDTTQENMFKELSGLSLNKADDQWYDDKWYDIDHNFDMRWNKENNKIEIREKNNPPGPYGQTSILLLVPSFLMQQGLITPEEMVELEKRIKDSTPVKERDSSIITPGYALKK